VGARRRVARATGKGAQDGVADLHQDTIFFLGPAVPLDGGVELIVPTLSALLAVPAREVGRDGCPPAVPHPHRQRVQISGCPDALTRTPLRRPEALLTRGVASHGAFTHPRTRSHALALARVRARTRRRGPSLRSSAIRGVATGSRRMAALVAARWPAPRAHRVGPYRPTRRMTVSSSSLVHAPLGTARWVVLWAFASRAAFTGASPGMAAIPNAAGAPGVVVPWATGGAGGAATDPR